jgi:hypothetical protein
MSMVLSMSNPRFDHDGGGIELDLDISPAVKASTIAALDQHFAAMAPTIAAINAGMAQPESPPPPPPLVDDLSTIAQQASANAATTGIGSLRGGQLRGVGFSSRDGYIQAIRNGVPEQTHAEYVSQLRARFGMTTADIAALDLPGPFVPAALPVGEGIKHVPTGPSIFDRPAAERGFKIGDAAEMVVLKQADLNAAKMVAIANAAGHGCVIAWNGRREMTRAALAAALAGIGHTELMPRAQSARAQAGRTVQALTGHGYVVRVERRPVVKAGELAPTYDARWTIGRVDHDVAAQDGMGDPIHGALGRRIAQVTLTGDALEVVTSDTGIEKAVRDGFQRRLGEEIYQAGDVTTWLSGVLRKHCDAVAFGALGYYIPPTRTELANQLCQAVRDAGWGAGWVVPGLPVTDSDHLRDGILRGLTDEVDDLLGRLAAERTAAAESRASGDIGERRAASFLTELRKIGERVVAYALVLGDERVLAARERIRLAIVELEGVLGDDHTGI